nr:unnamed protein product [Meloidogyne enterolobii]
MSPRLGQKQVIRNTWMVGQGWGREERSGGFPFKVGEPFELELIFEPKNIINVNVNKRFFTSFSRYDLSKISQMEIDAGIQLNSVTLCPEIEPTTTTKKPTTLLPTTIPTKPPPFCPEQIVLSNLVKPIPSIINLLAQGFGRGFAPNKRIIIHGTPTARTRFIINLAEDGVPELTGDIPLHFSPTFIQNDVIRDTWVRGKGWIRTERSGGLPFAVGRPFVLEFRAAPRNTIHIYVDNKSFATFTRYDLGKISQLEIKLAVRVSSVILCK